ncbi:sulfatase family protein [Paenibacillus cymbidii]|uniref:sulfatase family protein n=1 Tax=Paenibacillus cymbidii TaxID=1639034 RepID=UPI0010821447|nr:sulfatase-like hydrolase/transferase [Paenibacillus cymbidii]
MGARPNFLFLFPDSHRGDWMPYGAAELQLLGMERLPLRMPNIERLMAQGVTFTQAITPSPLCAPARACLAAGVRYERCGVADNGADYPPAQRTFYNALRDCGYRVGAVGKLDLHKASYTWGEAGWSDELQQLGFTDAIDNAGKIDAVVSGKDGPRDPYMKYLYDRGLAGIHIADMTRRKGQGTEATPLPEEAYCDNWLTQNGIAMLERFPRGEPWFLMVNFTGPHGPWDITRRMKDDWQDAAFPPPLGGAAEPERANAIRQHYAAMLANIDRNIGLLLDAVRGRGEADNTIVVYSSDHGEMLGDFGRYGKCVPYRGSVHIPLVIAGPGIARGNVSAALVELQDLAATFVDYAGGTMAEATDSVSLRPLLAGVAADSPHRTYQTSALHADGKHNKTGWKLVADEDGKLIRCDGREPELYEWRDDPWETANVAGHRPELLSRLLSCSN